MLYNQPTKIVEINNIVTNITCCQIETNHIYICAYAVIIPYEQSAGHASSSISEGLEGRECGLVVDVDLATSAGGAASVTVTRSSAPSASTLTTAVATTTSVTAVLLLGRGMEAKVSHLRLVSGALSLGVGSLGFTATEDNKRLFAIASFLVEVGEVVGHLTLFHLLEDGRGGALSIALGEEFVHGVGGSLGLHRLLHDLSLGLLLLHGGIALLELTALGSDLILISSPSTLASATLGNLGTTSHLI